MNTRPLSSTTLQLVVGLVVVVGGGAGFGACAPQEATGAPDGSGPGDGGAQGSGGAPATGGSRGSGGGTAATGGGPGSGGASGTGGGSASGGATGSGGTRGSGGSGSGGAGTGGRGGGGGAPGAGGVRGTGGRGTGGGAGGAGTGGVPAAGSGGDSGGWLTGYSATMFGNRSSGDCNGVANFSDMTNISGGVCTYQGVTIAPYSSGTANNSSFYGAPGDESSIWQGPTCRCPSGDMENASGLCGRAPSCPMEGDCGKCFEIKCDPNGTATYSDGATRRGAMYCNANQSVVIQITDACPHNHPSNTWWCTNQRKDHIDISCSAMKAIAGNPNNVGSWGWLNVQVRPVDCSVGLGAKTTM